MPKARIKNYGKFPRIQYYCPGCKSIHWLPYNYVSCETPSWMFNNDFDKPTLHPSILSTAGRGELPPDICHHFVRDGKIQYLDDCTHDLKGQTVEMEDF